MLTPSNLFIFHKLKKSLNCTIRDLRATTIMLERQFLVSDSNSGPIHKMTIKLKNELNSEANLKIEKLSINKFI